MRDDSLVAFRVWWLLLTLLAVAVIVAFLVRPPGGALETALGAGVGLITILDPPDRALGADVNKRFQ